MHLNKPSIAALLLSAALPAGAASAQSLPAGYYTDGYVELEYLSSDGSSDHFLIGELTFGYLPESGNGLRLGFEVGADFVATDGSDAEAYYAAVILGTNFGKFQIGAPRPVSDSYLRFPPVGGVRIFDTEVAALSGGSYAAASAKFSDTQLYGVRYDGEFGALKIGASAVRVDDAGFDAYELALNYNLGKATLLAGAQHLVAGGSTVDSYTLGVTGHFDKIDTGIKVTSGDLFGNDAVGHAFLSYKAMENLDLTASAVTIGSDATLYGLSAEYTFYQGAYVQAGYFGNDNGGNDVFDVSLGYKF